MYFIHTSSSFCGLCEDGIPVITLYPFLHWISNFSISSSHDQRTKARGNGEGSVFYNEKLGKWMAQYTAGRKDDGSLNRKSIYGKTQAEVRKS